MIKSYEKVLTKNDTGETGGHQGGVAVPRKNIELLDFFPSLNPNEFNPDTWITCLDPDGDTWKMRYIYYNGKTFLPPKSTRNEYRITHMTKFFTKWGAKSGDSVIFTSAGRPTIFKIQIKRYEKTVLEKTGSTVPKPVKLRGWRAYH